MRGSRLAMIASLLAIGSISTAQAFDLRSKTIGTAKNGQGRRTGIAKARRDARKRQRIRARSSKRA